jgi:mRNA interferase RelE/StbE
MFQVGAPAMVYTVEFTEEALAMLGEIQDRRIRSKLFERMKKLAVEPEQQGKPLVEELSGLRSVRALGQRYRIIFRIQDRVVTVVIVVIVGVGIRMEGHRTDVYARMAKLMRKQ